MAEFSADKPCRIFRPFDGGGAKGFYTLGVLREVENMLRRPALQAFDSIFGTTRRDHRRAYPRWATSVDEIYQLYKKHVPRIMSKKSAHPKSAALGTLSAEVFGDTMCDRIDEDRRRHRYDTLGAGDPHDLQSQCRTGTRPRRHVRAVLRRFNRRCGTSVLLGLSLLNIKTVTTAADDKVQLIDGGFCANSPALYAIADAMLAMKVQPEHIRVLSVGVGVYPAPKPRPLSKAWLMQFFRCAQLIQKTFEINTQSMEQLRAILFKQHIHSLRINEKFERPEMATDLFEHDLDKLNMLRQRGAETYARHELELQRLLN